MCIQLHRPIGRHPSPPPRPLEVFLPSLLVVTHLLCFLSCASSACCPLHASLLLAALYSRGHNPAVPAHWPHSGPGTVWADPPSSALFVGAPTVPLSPSALSSSLPGSPAPGSELWMERNKLPELVACVYLERAWLPAHHGSPALPGPV